MNKTQKQAQIELNLDNINTRAEWVQDINEDLDYILSLHYTTKVNANTNKCDK